MIDDSKCCGCGVCALVCPTNAISIINNERGFSQPAINNDLCVGCGACDRVCSFKHFHPVHSNVLKSFAVRHRDTFEVESSRSGAFFIALSDYVISNGGIIFGCVLDFNGQVFHTSASKRDEVKKFKGSKYVQSDLKSTFVECKNYLEKGFLVLYSGTGCQIHALLSFLKFKGITTEKLITVDIVCHGVTSPLVWNYYFNYLQEKFKHKIVEYNFRDKSIAGWKAHIESLTLSNSKKHFINERHSYYLNSMYRESCYSCPYTTIDRLSTFTIGDYWGIDKNAPELDDNKGVSLVIVHDDFGLEIMDQVSKSIIKKETDINNSLQPQLVSPSKKNPYFDDYWKRYKANKKRFIKYEYFSNLKFVVRKIKKVFRLE